MNIVLIISIFALGTVGCRTEQVQGSPLTQNSLTSMVTVPATPLPVSRISGEITSATATTVSRNSTELERLTPTVTEEEATPLAVPADETIEFTLQTAVSDHKMIYVGVGGAIDGLVNPDLEIKAGTKVQVTLLNGDGMAHDVKFPDFGARSALVHRRGDSTEISFEVGDEQTGIFPYFCTVPGHRKSGQEGRLIVSER